MEFFESLFAVVIQKEYEPILVFLIAMVILLIYLLIGQRRREREEKEMQKSMDEESAKRAKEHAKAEAYRNQENFRRTMLRNQWIKEHSPLTLYYNTRDGITAALTQRDYEEAHEQTRIKRIDEAWGSQTTLMLVPRTYIFVSERGKALIASRLDGSANKDVMGMRSYLQKKEEYSHVKLIQKSDIFVPFVNETLLPFEVQHRILVGFCSDGRERLDRDFLLVDMQAPEELLPLPQKT